LETTLTTPLARRPAPVERVQAEGCVSALAASDFDAIVGEHQRRIFRVLMTMLHDTDAADTLTQETFLRAYQSRATFRGQSSVATWLVRIAVNLACDHRRSRRTSFWKSLFHGSQAGHGSDSSPGGPDSLLAAAVHPGPSPERAMAARQDAAAAWAAADGLPQQQRAVFLLRFAEEMSLEEIAEATDLRTGTVKVHLHRAVQSVRRQLKEQGVR